MKSALFFTSPNVQVTLPPNWAAISVGPCQSEVWLSTTPPSSSASATAFSLSFARDVAQAVDQRHVGFVEKVGGSLDRLVERRFLAVDQRIGYCCSAVWFRNQRLAQDAGVLGLDDFRRSACSSMSSHTQPQNVQVAFLTM